MNATGPTAVTCTRRRLLAGGAGLAAAPLVAGARQIEGTPPVPLAPLQAVVAGETPAALAARLDYDARAIFNFVRDEIHFESYAGVLRGAMGTLWSRAGNAADQAMLLAALLESAQVSHRFAIGPLPPDRAKALGALLSPTAGEARAFAEQAATAAVLHAEGLDELPDEAPTLSGEDQARFDEQAAEADRVFAEGSDAAAQTGNMIDAALAAAGIALPALTAPTLTARELEQHAWLQVADGPDWIDLDPTVPDTEWGAAVGAAAATWDALPDDWHHQLTIAVAADDNYSGVLSRRDVTTLTTRSERTIDTPIAISMAPAESLGAVGLGITQLFTGQQTVYPSIIFGEKLVETITPMVFATDGASLVGALDTEGPIEGAAEGETVAVWLVVTITSPDAAPVVVERALLDRLPAADRATGTFTPASVQPITVTTNILGEEMVDAFGALTMIQAECATIPGYHLVSLVRNPTIFGSLQTLGPGMGAIRNALGIEHEIGAGVWSYPSAPNVTAFTFLAGEAEAEMSADILYRQRATLSLADASDPEGMHPGVRSGVLNAAAEAMLLAPATRGDLGGPATLPPVPSIGTIFRESDKAGIDVVALVTAGDLARIEADEVSTSMMRAALDAGLVVVTPGQPVEIGGAPRSGWWVIDPVTGATHDQLANGKGFASVAMLALPLPVRAQDTLAWYARWAQYMAENVEFFACLGLTLGLIALIVETKVLWPVSQGAAAITGGVSVFGAGGLSLC